MIHKEKQKYLGVYALPGNTMLVWSVINKRSRCRNTWASKACTLPPCPLPPSSHGSMTSDLKRSRYKSRSNTRRLSLVGAATNIFVVTKFVATNIKHIFCRDKRFVVTSILLSWQKMFCHDKHVFVMTKLCLLQQIFVMTKICCDKGFVRTSSILSNMCLSRQTCLLQQNFFPANDKCHIH